MTDLEVEIERLNKLLLERDIENNDLRIDLAFAQNLLESFKDEIEKYFEVCNGSS